MDKEFLEDYEQKEKEEIDKFEKKVLQGKFGPNEKYPPSRRFKKINEPLAFAAKGVSIYPQIPLFGSLVIYLAPGPREGYDVHGFDIKDIERLVDFALDTGKVQFVLGWNPTYFVGLDFLEPIFKELRPPCLDSRAYLGLVDARVFSKYRDEFLNISTIPLLPSRSNLYDINRRFFPNDLYAYRSFFHLADVWASLKLLGHEEITKQIEDLIFDEPVVAPWVLIALDHLVVFPEVSPLRAIMNCNKNLLNLLSSFLSNSPPILPIEEKFLRHGIDISKIRLSGDIGKFLMEKITYMPESLDACKDVIARYKQADLYKVMIALDDGVKRNDPSSIYDNKIELSTILDNVWKDRKFQRRISGLRYGIPISMALVGSIAAGPIGGTTGLLAGLGFSVGNRILGTKTDLISEKIAKYVVPNHLVTIYDFKKKYNLKS